MSAVVISAAGILTTILIAARGAIRSGARAMGSFGRALAKVAKKLAPVFDPNSVYSQNLTRTQVYDEARRFFGKANDINNDNLTKLDFLKNKYAIVVDLRTVNQENVVHSGRYIVGVQSGILIEIEKLETSVDLLCHVFVVADGSVSIKDLKFDKLIL